MIQKLGGRKTLITIICLAAGVAIDLATSRGLSENLLYLMIAIIGIYTGGNVITKKVSISAASKDSTTESSSIDQRQLEDHVAGLHSIVEDLQKQVGASNNRVAAVLKAQVSSTL